MAKNDNLKDFLTDVADAIREKKGTTEKINAQNFSEEIRSIESGGGSGWTGHADVEGLRAIGWDDDDIAYYQKYGVYWNEEDDEYHKVSDDNKALYGVLTAKNIQDYKDRIVYLPKIDTSERTSMQNLFLNCKYMVAMPILDTSNVTTMQGAFKNCTCLSCIPPFDFRKVTSIREFLYNCVLLRYFPSVDFSSVSNGEYSFQYCRNLTSLRLLGTPKISSYSYAFQNTTIMSALFLDLDNTTHFVSALLGAYLLVGAYFKNLKINLSITDSPYLSKDSLLYIINNEAATEAITITLHALAYARLAEDADVVVALANHPLISLASA